MPFSRPDLFKGKKLYEGVPVKSRAGKLVHQKSGVLGTWENRSKRERSLSGEKSNIEKKGNSAKPVGKQLSVTAREEEKKAR